MCFVFHRPGGVSLGVQIQAPVGLNHSVFNGSVSRPDQRQHLPHPTDRVGDAKLAHRHTKLHGLLDHCDQRLRLLNAWILNVLNSTGGCVLPFYLKWFSSTAWSWWRRSPSPPVRRRFLCLSGTAPTSPASSAPRPPPPPSLPFSAALVVSSGWPRRFPHQSLRIRRKEKEDGLGWKINKPFSPHCCLITQHFLQLLSRN